MSTEHNKEADLPVSGGEIIEDTDADQYIQDAMEKGAELTIAILLETIILLWGLGGFDENHV